MISKKDISKLEGLLYLYAVSKTNSKREVAGKLGTSVDTVSKYLADLENELKTYLLVSNGRGTVITPEGERILDAANDIVRVMRSIGDTEAAAEDDVYNGIVKISMPDSVADYIGSGWLADFYQKYPDVRIENHIYSDLPEAVADISLQYELPADMDGRLSVIRAKTVACGLFASQKYLDDFGTPKSINDLLENHRICEKNNHERCLNGWHDLADKARHLVYSTNSIFSYRSALDKGIGIGICPLSYGRENLVHLLKKEIGFTLNLYLAAERENAELPRVRVLLDYLKNVLDEKYD